MQNCSGDITQLLRKSFWLLSQVGKQHKEQAVVFQSCGSCESKNQRALPCELRQCPACTALRPCGVAEPGDAPLRLGQAAPVSGSIPSSLFNHHPLRFSPAALCAGGRVGLSWGQQELGVSEVCGTGGITSTFPASDLSGGAGCLVHKDFRLPVLVHAPSCFPSH